MFLTPSSHTELLRLPDCTHYSVSSSCVSSASVALPFLAPRRRGLTLPDSASLWLLLPSFSCTPWCPLLRCRSLCQGPTLPYLQCHVEFFFPTKSFSEEQKVGEGKGFTFSDISLVGSLSSKLIYLFSVNECFTYMYVNTPCACLWRRLIEVFLFVISMR